MIDLHVHSKYSDGSDTAEELINKAYAAGVSILALTDHDTVDGLEQAQHYAKMRGIRFIPGIELSTVLMQGEFHIVGYYLDYTSSLFLEKMNYIEQKRKERNQRVAANLRKLGMNITLEEVTGYASGQVGRLHFANSMVDKGYAKSVGEAFAAYLGVGGAAYTPRVTMEPVEAVEFIKALNGRCALAHPHLYDLTNEELYSFCAELKEHGLDGIEVFYAEHTPGQIHEYARIAQELQLQVSGGSDYHGIHIPGKRLGRMSNGEPIPDHCAQWLL